MSCIATKMSLPILDEVLGKTRLELYFPLGAKPAGFQHLFLNHTITELRNALGELKTIPLLLLKTDRSRSEQSGFRFKQYYYVKKSTYMKLAMISKKMQVIAIKFIPLIIQASQLPLKLSTVKLYAAGLRCVTTRNATSKLFPSILLPTAAGTIQRVSEVKVLIVLVGGEKCGFDNVLRWFDKKNDLDGVDTTRGCHRVELMTPLIQLVFMRQKTLRAHVKVGTSI